LPHTIRAGRSRIETTINSILKRPNCARHIKIGHPEIGNDIATLSRALSNLDKAYENGQGWIHSLLRQHGDNQQQRRRPVGGIASHQVGTDWSAASTRCRSSLRTENGQVTEAPRQMGVSAQEFQKRGQPSTRVLLTRSCPAMALERQ
jgi:hypothetical protein